MTADDIRTIVESFPEKKSALLPLLHGFQRERGWLSPETMVEVGEILDLSPAQVLEVVSFYTLFRQEPVGRHHIQVCRTTSCFICGAFDVLRHLDQRHGIRAGEVTDDGKFSLEIVECIALCHQAPAIQVNMAFHGNVTPDSIDTLLAGLE
jgi:NADH-quinone oxidoreductase subunit E